MADLTIYVGNKNYASWSLRAWLALKATGEAFEEVVIPLFQPGSKETLLKYSPSGKVPALHHGDIVVWDSLAICGYLTEKFPAAGLWPDDPAAKAVARSISAEMHSSFQALRRALSNEHPLELPGTRDHSGGAGRHQPGDGDLAPMPQPFWRGQRRFSLRPLHHRRRDVRAGRDPLPHLQVRPRAKRPIPIARQSWRCRRCRNGPARRRTSR